MRINNLPNWCIPDSSPAFYDTDSKSALDQTAKLYGIIKKLVADYNEYAKELDKGMENFEEEVKKLQSEFEEEITKVIHDYIIALDAKVDHQDRVIEENITYIKNNIGAEVTRIIDEMKESGELDAIIADSLDSVNERITTIEGTVTSIQENVSNLVPKVTTNETNIKALQTNTSNLDTRIKDIEESEVIDIYAREQIDNITSKNQDKFYIFIGDSYARPSNSWVEHCAIKLDIGDNYVKSALGSTGFARAVDGKTFKTLLEQSITLLTEKGKTVNDVTDIIVCGGANDSLCTHEEIISSIEVFMNYAKETFINAEVKIGAIGWTRDSEEIVNYGKAIGAYTESVLYGACYLNNVEYILHNYDLISSDNVHPTDTGYEILGSYISQAIKYGSCNVIYNQRQTGFTGFSVFESLNNNLVSVFSNRLRTLGNLSIPSVTCNGQTGIELGNLGSKYVFGSYYETNRCPVHCYIFCDEGAIECEATIGVYDGKLYLYPMKYGNDVPYKTLTNITSIYISQFKIVMNALEC